MSVLRNGSSPGSQTGLCEGLLSCAGLLKFIPALDRTLLLNKLTCWVVCGTGVTEDAPVIPGCLPADHSLAFVRKTLWGLTDMLDQP